MRQTGVAFTSTHAISEVLSMLREAREVPILPALPSVQAGLTRRFVCDRTARQPVRGTSTSPSIVLNLLQQQGPTDMHANYCRHCAECQYSLADFSRIALTSLVEGIIK